MPKVPNNTTQYQLYEYLSINNTGWNNKSKVTLMNHIFFLFPLKNFDINWSKYVTSHNLIIILWWSNDYVLQLKNILISIITINLVNF